MYTSWWLPEEVTPFWLGFHASTPKPCSGSCCGNQRKWFGEKPIQERKADLALDDEW